MSGNPHTGGTQLDDSCVSDDLSRPSLNTPPHRKAVQKESDEFGKAAVHRASPAPALTSIGVHPLADLFPPMSIGDFTALVADIKANGLQVPIVTLDGLILDGRHRHRACIAAGVKPVFKNFAGDDPFGFVMSANMYRRHLTESQRGMVAAAIVTMRQGSRTDLAQICARSQQQAADRLNVSRRTVQHATVVRERGIPALLRLVEQREMSVSVAAKIARMPKEQQIEIAKLEGSALRAAVERGADAEREITSPTFTLITDDVVCWSEEQAAAVRDAAKNCTNQPIDFDNVSNKIADVGKKHVRETEQRVLTLLTYLYERQMSTGGLRDPTINRERRALRLLLEAAPSLKQTVPAMIGRQQDSAKTAAVSLSENLRHHPKFDPTLAGPSFTADELLDDHWFPERLFERKAVPTCESRSYHTVDVRKVHSDSGTIGSPHGTGSLQADLFIANRLTEDGRAC